MSNSGPLRTKHQKTATDCSDNFRFKVELGQKQQCLLVLAPALHFLGKVSENAAGSTLILAKCGSANILAIFRIHYLACYLLRFALYAIGLGRFLMLGACRAYPDSAREPHLGCFTTAERRRDPLLRSTSAREVRLRLAFCRTTELPAIFGRVPSSLDQTLDNGRWTTSSLRPCDQVQGWKSPDRTALLEMNWPGQ